MAPETVHGWQFSRGWAGARAAPLPTALGGSGAEDETDVQAASIVAAQARMAAVSVARPCGSARVSARMNGMPVILPHAAECNGPQAVLPSDLRRSASARRYSSMTISLSSVTEVSLLGLSKVISPCCSRLIRSEISSTWP